MAHTRVEIAGVLRTTEDGGIEFSLPVGKPPNARTLWLEALPGAFEREWQGYGKLPEKPEPKKVSGPEWQRVSAENKAAEEAWDRARADFIRAVHASSEYREAASEFVELQRREPQALDLGFWLYRDKVVKVTSAEPEPLHENASHALLVKHHVLRRERQFDRIRREVEALENFEKLDKVSREPIPESVRLFVWQRDRGLCVKCGARERLEFDHVIPVVAGGSNTERNVQLLCETCNRSKGSNV